LSLTIDRESKTTTNEPTNNNTNTALNVKVFFSSLSYFLIKALLNYV
jgi:hypothetical protein